MIGVLAGAARHSPGAGLLNHAYGFLGAPGANPARALPAPQAGLISALAQGVIQNNIDWSLIGTGVLIGTGCIVIDEILRRTSKSVRLPPLAVGLGIYLPTSATLMVVVGAMVGFLFNRRADRRPGRSDQAAGCAAGLGADRGGKPAGVVFAAVVAFSGNAAPIALVGTASIPPASGSAASCSPR